MSLPRVGKQKARDEILPRAGSARWAYLALLRGTRSGNDRLGTRVQGLSFGVRRLVAAFARRDSSRRTSAPVTSHRRQKAGASSRTPKTAPPIRALAFDGHAKAAPARERGIRALDDPIQEPKIIARAPIPLLWATGLRESFLSCCFVLQNRSTRSF